MDNKLQNFLKSTGWSCEDLLKKLNQYKAVETSVEIDENLKTNVNNVEEIDENLETNVNNVEEIDENLETNVNNVEDYVVDSIGENYIHSNENTCDINLELQTDTECMLHNDKLSDIQDDDGDENVQEVQVIQLPASDNEDDDNHYSICSSTNSSGVFTSELTPESVIDNDKIYNSVINEQSSKDINTNISPTEIENYAIDDDDDDDEYFEDEDERDESDTKCIEDIRNNLKLQLSSLRNRKKEHILQEVTTKIIETNKIENKKLIEDIICSKVEDIRETNKPSSYIKVTQNLNIEESSEKHFAIESNRDNTAEDSHFFSETNDLGLVILNVEGGVVEFEEEDSQDSIFEDKEKLENSEDLSVFAEIRRIIQKPKSNYQAKSFSVNSSESEPVNKGILGKSTNALATIKNPKNRDNQSPFVSNELDEFLTADSHLNISYNVPKSGAEEGLTDSYRAESPVLDRSNESTDVKLQKTKKESSAPRIKAKTLAEKRKLLEKQNRIKQRNNPVDNPFADVDKVEENNYELNNESTELKKNKCKQLEKKKLVTAKPKYPSNQIVKTKKDDILNEESFKYPRFSVEKQKPDYNQIETKDPEQLIFEKNTTFSQRYVDSSNRSILKPSAYSKKKDKNNVGIKRGFVMYNDRKIFVPCSSGKCICNIKDDIGLVQKDIKITNSNVPQKPSLWYSQKNPFSSGYKPGPLCKKRQLAITDKDKFKTEIKVLPKPILEIMPEFGKSIDAKIAHLLPICDGKVSDFLIEFALSAVIPNKNHKKDLNIFGIQVPYEHKQQNYLVQKLVNPKTDCNILIQPPERVEDSRNSIKSIVNDLITYVEHKEIADTIIADEPLEEYNANIVVSPMKTESTADNISALVNRKQKKSRVVIELARLNCKVVNVKVKEDLDCFKCEKEYCKLGCVCNSLSCEPPVPSHCKKIECMFECGCPKKEIIYDGDKFPLCADLLSTDTVHQIDKTAKRNMAKVEKEFTHTVICTNDKAIMVGAGDRKLKRITKAPKKYEDFFASNCIENEEFESFNNESMSKDVKNFKHIPVTVAMENLQLPGIIPFCMYHQRYNCICMSTKYSETSNIDSSSSSISECARMLSAKGCIKRNRRNLHLQKVLAKLRRKESKCDDTNNQDIVFYSHDFPEPEITDAQLLKNIIEEDRVRVLKMFKPPVKNNVFVESHKSTKRKSLVDDEDKAIQRRKKNKVYCSYPEPIFEGEIFVDDKNYELLKHMDAMQIGYARLLPWKSLLDNFSKSKIRMWTQPQRMHKLFMNTADKPIPDGCYDIRIYTPDIDVCKWLLTSRLPDSYNPENISFILREYKGNFEICGICNRHAEGGPNALTIEESDNKKIRERQVEELKHRDKEDMLHTLLMTGFKCSAQKLSEKQPGQLNLQTVVSNLPVLTDSCRWRTFILKSDFTYLHLKNSNYSVRYTILKRALEKAVKEDLTIKLSSEAMAAGYQHREFGLYFSPNCPKNFFVGPYMFYEDHNLETLRYISQCLVDTESYNIIQGNQMNSINSYWLYTQKLVKKNTNTCIALFGTPPNDNSTIATVTSSSSSSSDSAKSKSNNIDSIVDLTGDDCDDNFLMDKVAVLETSPRTPNEFNRYMITNIPNFGYLGAYLHEATEEIDVSWPFENKVLRFKNINQAKTFFQHRFSSLLITIPVDFKINIVIVRHLNLNINRPINPQCLGGYFICGEFGLCNAKVISETEAVARCGVNRDYIYRLLAKRAQQVVASRMQSFAKSLNLFEGEVKRADMPTILDRACSEIIRLREMESQLQKEKIALKNENHVLSTYAQNLIYETNNVKKGVTCEQIEKEKLTSQEGQQGKTRILRKKSNSTKEKTAGFTISTDEVRHNSSKESFLPQKTKVKLKSILKPINKIKTCTNKTAVTALKINTTLQDIEKTNSVPIKRVNNVTKNFKPQSAKILSGVKIVKSPNGQLILVSAKNKVQKLDKKIIVPASKLVPYEKEKE